MSNEYLIKGVHTGTVDTVEKLAAQGLAWGDGQFVIHSADDLAVWSRRAGKILYAMWVQQGVPAPMSTMDGVHRYLRALTDEELANLGFVNSERLLTRATRLSYAERDVTFRAGTTVYTGEDIKPYHNMVWIYSKPVVDPKNPAQNGAAYCNWVDGRSIETHAGKAKRLKAVAEIAEAARKEAAELERKAKIKAEQGNLARMVQAPRSTPILTPARPTYGYSTEALAYAVDGAKRDALAARQYAEVARRQVVALSDRVAKLEQAAKPVVQVTYTEGQVRKAMACTGIGLRNRNAVVDRLKKQH